MPAHPTVRHRLASEADLDACCGIWKRAIDDYEGRLNQPAAPDDLSGLRRLLAHLLATDPERFWVAVDAADRPLGFSSAHVRGDLWFLAMLFVEPSQQAGGIGRGLLDRAFGDAPVGWGHPKIRRWGTCTDSAQPISNALYARAGIVPRVPIWRLTGEIRRRDALPLPGDDVVVDPFEAVVAEGADGHARLASLVNAIDREVLGYERPADHAFLRRDGRRGFLLRGRAGEPAGYGYAAPIGRVGPIAARDPRHLAPLLGWVTREVPANGARAIWLPGTAGEAFTAALAAGLRLEGFPGLLCWSTPDTPFERYVPISLALV